MAAITVADIAAEGGDLDGIAACIPHRHQHHSKLRAYCVGFREDPHHLVGRSIGGDVVVGGLAPQQQIAHTSADEVGLVAVLAQGANNLFGEFFSLKHFSCAERRSPAATGQPRAAVPTWFVMRSGAGIPLRPQRFAFRLTQSEPRFRHVADTFERSLHFRLLAFEFFRIRIG